LPCTVPFAFGSDDYPGIKDYSHVGGFQDFAALDNFIHLSAVKLASIYRHFPGFFLMRPRDSAAQWSGSMDHGYRQLVVLDHDLSTCSHLGH
jgi:hypothetical protein